MAEVVGPPPVRAERVPHASAPLVLSELQGARVDRAWEIAGAAACALAVMLLALGVAVLR
ncbi:MAG: hypothetical protein JSS74_10860 [Actinobacteria bacterium]|nr:hypothetical protein [Actinomycetota bacterium]